MEFIYVFQNVYFFVKMLLTTITFDGTHDFIEQIRQTIFLLYHLLDKNYQNRQSMTIIL